MVGGNTSKFVWAWIQVLGMLAQKLRIGAALVRSHNGDKDKVKNLANRTVPSSWNLMALRPLFSLGEMGIGEMRFWICSNGQGFRSQQDNFRCETNRGQTMQWASENFKNPPIKLNFQVYSSNPIIPILTNARQWLRGICCWHRYFFASKITAQCLLEGK